MEKINRFNIRVYGILIKDKKLLLLHEMYLGNFLMKFPGGGVEFGEGLHDTLKREFLEELDLRIEIDSHFYTQDFFLRSKFSENEQIITHYYLVNTQNINPLKKKDKGIKDLHWIDIHDLKVEDFTLPVDKIVAQCIINSKDNLLEK